jgi:antirestriction protein ArdC
MAFQGKSKYSKPTTDIHAIITDQIVKLLENDVRPWSRSWGGKDITTRPLRITGEPYRGINVLVLWMAAQANGYTSPYWISFNRAKELGGFVRKGEHSTLITKPKPYKFVVNEGTPDEEEKTGKNFSAFPVFNCDQIDGLPEKFRAKVEPVIAAVKNERIPHAEAFFAALPIVVNHGGVKAFHNPQTRRVQMPNFEAFFAPEAYYVTRYHESIHWTRHSDSLDRNFGQSRWGDDGYAMEELVAELGAAYGAADLGLVNHPREDHASYIASWLKVLKADKKAIFTAAAHAERAVKYLNDIVNPASVTTTTEEIEERIAA